MEVHESRDEFRVKEFLYVDRKCYLNPEYDYYM